MELIISEQEALSRYTSWKIGGPARYRADASSPAELASLLGWASQRDLPVFLLGGGSNLLALDEGYPGLVLRYRASATQIDEQGDTVLARVDAGAPMAGTARKLAHQGYAGLEWAEGLPGTIGGAMYGNAGCYGGSVASVLRRAWLWVGGQIEEWPVEQLGYGYRTSALKRGAAPASQRPIILAAEFAMRRADPQELARTMAETSVQRRAKTPHGQSCGSVFKNPPGDSAGRLIEAAGLKGARVGNAQIAERHANYIINMGGATSADVLALIDMARDRVRAEFGLELELEVQIMRSRRA